MELMNIYLKTTHFQFEDKFNHKKCGMEVGSSLSPVVSCVFMEHLQGTVLGTADHKPAVGSDTSMILSRFGYMGQQDCNSFFTSLSASDLP
jgi:hypothetical protein